MNYNTKDHIPRKKKWSIYQNNCKDCEIYVGKEREREQRKKLETKVAENVRNIKNGEIEKSA